MSKFKFISIFITLAILYTINVRAADIVRLQFDYADPAEYTPDPDSTWEVPLPPLPRTNYTYFLDLELFTDSAPDTVANYLDYVTSGSYDGTFIYRSLTDFVMQTGGYTFRPNDPVNNPLRTIAEATGLEKVPVGPLSPVLNEFNRSNLRGTIAMAKLDNQPDSASNEWFINLADNSANLDSQNGGFTVFGGVIDDGMAIITDEISTFYIHNFISVLLGSAFNNMPVTSAIYGAIYQSDMIMITSATVINRPIVRFAPAVGDYDLDIAGDSIVELLTTTVKNTGNENAVIGTVNSADLAAPFSLVTDNCSDAILQPQSILSTSVCTIVFSFSAATEGAFNDDINIPYTSQISGDTFSVAYPLKGVGVPGTPVISSDTINLNTFETMANTSTDETVTIRNEGGSTLNIINIGISGVDAADFSILSGCSTGTNLAMEESCTVSIRFSPTTAGTKTGALNVDSNAGSLTVDLAGLSTQPVISVQSSIDIVAQLNQTASNYALVTNTGTGDLTLFTMDISGTDAAFFTQINNCPDTNNSGGATAPLGASQQCVILIEYTPT
ncbi:MAG: choice-of-anchor D domain-containing protein, partial [Gammaproteobacteria bacterium]|nr:choice-of-anchor D domain-containing protein [Gammaproteobacteria bacterium]